MWKENEKHSGEKKKKTPWLTTYRLCRIAMLAATMVALKEALAWLPNGELVTVMVVTISLTFGWEALIITIVFSALEILIYGFGLWTIMYFYVWNILVLLVMLLRRVFGDNRILWTILMAAYGLCFGALCAIPYLFMGGWSMAFTWWCAGIPFDLMHCGWNAVFGFLAFKPLLTIMRKGRDLKLGRNQ